MRCTTLSLHFVGGYVLGATMTSKFRKALESGGVILFDGAMGTQLTARGVTPGASASVAASEAVLAIHRAYHEAGANVITTNTFGANKQVLARAGESDQLRQYVKESCRLAREATGGGFIAGDIGPTGELPYPYGTATMVETAAVFEEAAKLLAECDVDLFIVETMSDEIEMMLAIHACRTVAPMIPIAASMAFDPSLLGGFRTNMGISPVMAANPALNVSPVVATEAMTASEADIIGANCGSVTPEQMAEIVREIRSATDKPILIQPNAGVPELQAGQTIFRLAPEAFAEGMKRVLEAGTQLVGGCCGTTPEHIRCLRQVVDKFEADKRRMRS
jgi:5-methyltetrahydrofolate--homocysteine methyltransferase